MSHTESEVYPSCVDVVDIWPPPYSVLQSLHEYPSYSVYVIKVSFSRQVKLVNLSKTYISFTVSTIHPLKFSPYYTKYAYGSGRAIWGYFRVFNSVKYTRYGIIVHSNLIV